MFSQPTAVIRAKIMEDIKQSIEEAWLNELKAQIKKEKIEALLKNPAVKLMVENAKSEKGATIKRHGLKIKTSDYEAFRRLEGPATSIIEDYKKQFANKFWGKLTEKGMQAYFSEMLDGLNIALLIQLFVKRHPWTLCEGESLHVVDSNLASRFIYDLVMEAVSPLLASINEGRHLWKINDKIPHQDLAPCNIDRANLPGLIEEYLFADVAKLFLGNALGAHKSCYTQAKVNKPFWNDSALLSRIDLFRFLANAYPECMEASSVGGSLFTKMAPLDINELNQLTVAQWKHLETLVVNYATESDPLWIVLHKNGKKWTAYVPEEFTLHRTLQKVLPEIKFEVVEYKNNQDLNNINSLSLKSQWHAILLGRVLPWCRSGQGDDLAVFRDKVPVSLLTQWVLEQCISVPLNYNNDSEVQQFVYTFANRRPFSDYSAEQLYSLDERSKNQVKHLLDNLFIRGYVLVIQGRKKSFDSKQTAIEIKCETDGLKYSVTGLDGQPQQGKILWNQLPNDFPRSEYLIACIDKKKASYHLGEVLKVTSKAGHTYQDNMSVGHVLTCFDNRYYTISDDLKTLTINAQHLDLQGITDALTIVYHNAITTLDFPPAKHNKLVIELFDYDPNIKTILTRGYDLLANKPAYAHPIHCAARNRFLAEVDQEYVDKAQQNIQMRKNLWEKTGEQIALFFKKNNEALGIDFVNQFKKFKDNWQKTNCQDISDKDLLIEPMWAFAQIAQMGTKGLDVFFDHLEKYYAGQWQASEKAPAPELPCTFDLSGDLINTPEEYLLHLINKIQNFDGKKQGCTPLFHSLALILPKDIKGLSLIDLLKVLDERKKAHPEEVNELVLHNLKPGKTSRHLIKNLQKQADENNLQILIRIPAWDRKVFEKEKNRDCKAFYRTLQNKILDNQRHYNQSALSKNMANIHACVDGTLDPTIIIDDKLALQTQSWDVVDMVYPLTTQTPGIQLQQQVEQEVEQEQSVEMEEEIVQEQQISQYHKDERLLITRTNINERCASMWADAPAEQKEHAGTHQGDLGQLFSLWVGSYQNASQVIEKIEPAAVQKIMQYAAQFRLGVSKDNLPSGFYLCNSTHSKGLVLCFNEAREKTDLRARAALPLKKRDSFKVELHNPKPATVFRGDFRQFAAMSSDSLNLQQTLWRYLATEDSDKLRMKEARHYLADKPCEADDQNASVIMQRIDALKDVNQPDNFQSFLISLRDWAEKHQASQAFLSALFDEESPSLITEHNAKAFGQLFNHYDTLASEHNGTASWLLMAQQVYDAFGPQHFAIWKKRVLDPSQNWTECLEKPEVDALALSIITLRDKPAHQAVWWQLVDAHGEATHHMQYAQLWTAYQKILFLLESKKLNLNQDAMITYLASVKDFNGQVFLDRLHRVLKNADKQLDSRAIQQSLLDQVNQIDWRHNGYYYASCYESYPYWDNRLQLSNFAPTIQDSSPSYVAKWNNGEQSPVTSLYTHALRFASQRLQFNANDLNKFEQLIRLLGEKEDLLMRILVGSLAIGIDKLQQLVDDKQVREVLELIRVMDPRFLSWFNSQLSLDGDLTTNRLQMCFTDIPLFYATLVKQGLLEKVLYLEYPQSLAFMNACGRAVCCFRKNELEQQVNRLLHYVNISEDLLHPVLTDYPWLIADLVTKKRPDIYTQFKNTYADDRVVLVQLDYFVQQLRSIDFTKDNYFPDYDQLDDAFDKIARAGNDGARVRCLIVSGLIEKGCAITRQDTAFRKLKEEEKSSAMRVLSGHLKPIFRDQNLALFETLINDHLAVKADADPAKQVEQFSSLLKRLDNKLHFNEVGQILGTLLNKAKVDGKNYYYSLPQLTGWIKRLIDEQVIDRQHYPVDLLNEILTDALTQQNSGLLTGDLNSLLVEGQDHYLQRQVEAIISMNLPSQYKPFLIKLAIQCGESKANYFLKAQNVLMKLHQDQVDPSWMKATCRLIMALTNLDADSKSVIKELTMPLKDLIAYPTSPSLKLWQRSQIKIIDLLLNNKINPNKLLKSFIVISTSDAYIKMILAQAIRNWDEDKHHIKKVRSTLKKWNMGQLALLAEYYAAEPYPSMAMLARMLQMPDSNTATQVIHQFETVEQARHSATGRSKRDYSISEEDNQSLQRILAGFKRKGQGFIPDGEKKLLVNLLYYMNNYSEVSQLHRLPMEKLQQVLKSILQERGNNKHYSSACLLACMREILLRKSGKWANHTQMLDLLYAAVYNDESMLHQVRTGQGKSIISIMRASYLALNGYVVDVFSAKDSLSRRDHEEFATVLDAMGIPHGYIKADSQPDEYKAERNAMGIGAVNYATMGNFSLFQSTQVWKGETLINLEPANRVAFLDEADHILKDENTQFNYSDNSDSDGVYNMDEWVYRVAYDFYIERKDSFPLNEAGVLTISRLDHIRALCALLQKQVMDSPKESKFFQRYIIPALQNQPDALARRDEQLKLLITSAHVAFSLQEGVNFCIRPDIKTISGGRVINTRVAKVVIDNQIKNGSTYSDGVQQFLHVRLNKEAVEKGEKPDFFVESCSQIAISQNANYLLKKHYCKLEGCTGTAGDSQDLSVYESEFGIKHVVKLSPHEVLRTEYLPTLYCDSDETQVLEIVKSILAHQQQPILITCRDDIEVKRIAEKVRVALAGNESVLSKLMVDTNDSGRSERDVLPLAGLRGRVIISSRLGRGTDIKPETELGLMVLRTYTTIPRVAKQERGRQGRNGAAGLCQDIIDFSKVEAQYKRYEIAYPDRLSIIMREQQQHLQEKFKKDQKSGLKKWDWLSNDVEAQEKYLKARSVEQLHQEIKTEQDHFLRRKEYLIASLSGNVMDILHQQMVPGEVVLVSNLQQDWLHCRKNIEAAWNARLADKNSDSEEVYQQFSDITAMHWDFLCQNHRALNAELIYELKKPVITAEEQATLLEDKVPANMVEMPEIIRFYQDWMRYAQQYFEAKPAPDQNLVKAVYGIDLLGMYKVFSELRDMFLILEPARCQKISKGLSQLMSLPSIYHVSCSAFGDIVKQLATIKDDKHVDDYFTCLEWFFNQQAFKKSPQLSNAADVEKNSLLLTLVMDIVNSKYVAEDEASLKFIDNFCQVIQQHYWHQFNNDFVDKIKDVFVSEGGAVLTKTNQIDLHYFIELITKNRSLGEVGINREQQLIAYLQNNVQGILQAPAVLRPVFALTLEERPLDSPDNYLPEANCLPHLSPAMQSEFWHFLTNRQPLVAEECEQLIALLSDHKADKPFLNQVLKPLFELPASISLAYIIKQLELVPGRYYFGDCQDHLQNLKEAGEAFNRFLLSRSLSNTPETIKEAQAWHHRFNAATLECNLAFYQLAKKYDLINNDIMAELHNIFQIEGLNYPLKSVLNLAEKIARLDPVKMEFIQTIFSQVIRNSNYDELNMELEKLGEFIALVDNKNQPLDARDLRILFKTWDENKHDALLIKHCLEVVNEIKLFERKYPDTAIFEFYCLSEINQACNERWMAFFNLLKAQENSNFEQDTILPLCVAYLNVGSAMTGAQLEKTFAVIKVASTLKHQENYASYFSGNSGEKSQQRQDIMQYLQHDLLNLGESFSKRCYEEYQNMANNLSRLPKSLSKAQPQVRAGVMRKCYQEVIKLTKELDRVTRHPFSGDKLVDSQVNEEPALSIHQAYFAEQKKCYGSSWFVNKVRKEQARNLFTDLDRVATNTGKNTYYTKTLETIWKSQKTLLESDKNTHRNTKGYSRLYDISVQMFLTVARDYLADSEVTCQQKAALNPLLQEQFTYHLDLMHERLPAGHGLKETLTDLKKRAARHEQPWKSGSTELADLSRLLANLDKKGLDKHLHYLVDNLACFVDLSNSLSVKQPESEKLQDYAM